MNLVKKFPTDTLVEIASKVVSFDDTNRSKEPAIFAGTRGIQDIKQGWFVKAGDNQHSKITSITITQGEVKKVSLSSGNFFYIDATSTIEVGESFNEYGDLITSTVLAVENIGSMDLYELTTEGDGGLLINNVTIA